MNFVNLSLLNGSYQRISSTQRELKERKPSNMFGLVEGIKMDPTAR